MYRFRLASISLSAAFLLLAGCAANSNTTGPTPPTPAPTPAPQISVLAAGQIAASSTQPNAAVWKDGVMTVLAPGQFSEGYTVVGDGTNVYVGGAVITGQSGFAGQNGSATIWKNGVPTTLTDANHSSVVLHMVISGQDVYAAGYVSDGVNTIPTVWKNGVPSSLPTVGLDLGNTNFGSGTAYAVQVVGTNVYVAGYEYTVVTPSSAGTLQAAVPVLWKNGVEQRVDQNGRTGVAYSIAVSGTDVYVAGIVYPLPESTDLRGSAAVWKNGALTTLEQTPGAAYSVVVSGSHVYVAGDVGINPRVKAVLWVDDVATDLNQGNEASHAGQVLVSGSDVYVAGYRLPSFTNTSLGAATVWKNGTPTVYTQTPTFLDAMYLVQH